MTEENSNLQSSVTGRLVGNAALESDDNSLLLDDASYIGVDTEYRNAAYESSAPLKSEDSDAGLVEELMKAAEVEAAQTGEQIGRLGYRTDDTHPSEKKNWADEAMRNNASRMAGLQQAPAEQGSTEEPAEQGEEPAEQPTEQPAEQPAEEPKSSPFPA